MTPASEAHGGAAPADISLTRHQLTELRTQLKQLNDRIATYEARIRRNEDLLAQVFEFAHSLLRCTSRDEALRTAASRLKAVFEIDDVVLLLGAHLANAPPAPLLTRPCPKSPEFDELARRGRSHCRRFKPAQHRAIFGERALDVRSCALIPLGAGAMYGFIARCSTAPDRFTPDKGTYFLDRLGTLISAKLQHTEDTE